MKQLNSQHIEKYQQQQKLQSETLKVLNDECEKQKNQIAKLTAERDKLI
jgi:chromosome segregation ATPase